ncbi:MAG: hypothetical protein AAGI08_10625 [Bacteroidota bacterium]
MSVLPSFVHSPDEVILEFAEATHFAPQALRAELLTADQLALVTEIDGLLDTLPVDLDYPTALRQMELSPEWATLRTRARALLDSLNEELRPPDSGTVVYV